MAPEPSTRPAWSVRVNSDEPKTSATARPPPTSFRDTLRHLGPGLIVTACIVGSGELIATTKLGAQAGFVLLWLILLGCVVKVFIQVELGRYSISEGRSTLEAMNQLPGPRWIVSWILWLWLFMYVAVVFQVAGIAGGIAQVFTTLDLGWSEPTWVVVVSTSCAALLLLGRYRLVERLSISMVALFTLCTIGAALQLQGTEFRITSAEIWSGLDFSLPRDSVAIAFAAFGITGVGATELIYYPYWCLEKGYARFVGERDDTPEWTARAKGWVHVMKIDAWVSMVVYTVATVAFYLLGAAILHRQGKEVEGSDLIPTLSTMYSETFGANGLWIFLIGAFFVLYSTFFVGTASNARLFADGLTLFKLVRYRTTSQRVVVVKIASALIPAAAATLFLFVGDPVLLVLTGAFAQALMLPFLAFTALYLVLFRTSPALRPGKIWLTCLVVAFISISALTLYQFVNEDSKVREFLRLFVGGSP